MSDLILECSGSAQEAENKIRNMLIEVIGKIAQESY
jgi:hypothetical protein